MSKIAFCFLLTDTFKHTDIWNKFFKGHESKYNIYSHIKFPDSPNIPKSIKDKRIKTIKTAWCDESLITAFLNMIKEGLKDPNNEYFVILSGDCIPLYNFVSFYKKLFRDNRSMMDIDVIKNKPLSGLKGDKGQHLYGSQWAIFNRKVATDFLGIKKQYKNLEFTMEYQHCPDELYPIYYFLNLYGPDFKKNIKIKKINYTEWDKKNTEHPILFDKKHTRTRSKSKKSKSSKRRRSVTLNKMCTSGALFARKFKTQEIGKKFAMRC